MVGMKRFFKEGRAAPRAKVGRDDGWARGKFVWNLILPLQIHPSGLQRALPYANDVLVRVPAASLNGWVKRMELSMLARLDLGLSNRAVAELLEGLSLLL